MDDTCFEKDADGEVLKAELRNGGTLVSKVEFPPNGGRLWIYDTAADGDAVYVRLRTAAHGWSAVFYATGAQNPHVVDFDFAEGENVLIEVYDNSDATDRIASFSARA
ncbi:hypothetical protein [Streptomyces hydrogenans]|uniref:hypothetical protein n=1 Tax=Streptomyces hydrogenans TaxID=1873719 RepID=UPI0036AB371D